MEVSLPTGGLEKVQFLSMLLAFSVVSRMTVAFACFVVSLVTLSPSIRLRPPVGRTFGYPPLAFLAS